MFYTIHHRSVKTYWTATYCIVVTLKSDVVKAMLVTISEKVTSFKCVPDIFWKLMSIKH